MKSLLAPNPWMKGFTMLIGGERLITISQNCQHWWQKLAGSLEGELVFFLASSAIFFFIDQELLHMLDCQTIFEN